MRTMHYLVLEATVQELPAIVLIEESIYRENGW